MKNFNQKNLLSREEMAVISGGRSKVACVWRSFRIKINDLTIKEADETYAQCRGL